jgi:hypothetical protein
LRRDYGAANPIVMELDEASMAIGRIERALSRIEKSLSDRTDRPSPSISAATAAHDALKAEVTAVIGDLDRLIEEASRG